MLVTPLHVGWGDRRSVVELRPLTQPERRTLRVLGELVAFGQRGMVVELIAEVLDQAIVECCQEVVGTGGSVVLQRIEPAYRDVGVPGQRELSFRSDRRRQ